MTSGTKRLTNWGCRKSLLLPAIVLVPVAFVVMAALVNFAVTRQVSILVTQLASQASAHLIANLRRDLEKPHLLVDLNVQAMRAGDIDSISLFNNPEAWFFRQHRLFPSINDVYFGRSDGAIAGIDRTDGHFLLKLTSQVPHRDFFELDDQGRRQKLVKSNDYDASSRDWYKRAVSKGQAVWSDIYILQNKNQLGITAARPALNRSGDLVGVMGVNLTLNTISDYLQENPISPHSVSYIVEASGLLVASSTRQSLFGQTSSSDVPVRSRAIEVNHPVIAESSRYLEAARLSGVEASSIAEQQLSIAGSDYILHVARYQDERGLDWRIVSAISRDDFMGEANTLMRNTAVVGIVLVIVLAMIGGLVGNWVAKPIVRLNSAARRISEGSVGDQVELSDGPREVLELAASFNEMSSRLARTMADLRELTVVLESKVDERTALLRSANEALEIARSRAEAANEAKASFLANMSHEIRTPMNVILGMSRLVMNTELDFRQRGYVSKVVRSAENLLHIINDILDFSKIEANKLVMEETPFALDDVLENLGSVLAFSAEDKGLELMFNASPELPGGLVGDPLRLEQILTNLVGNAIKFTEKGEIVVGIEVAERGEQDVLLRFCVRDSGIGMNPAQCEQIFDAFSQADASTTRRFGGTGLGLAISRKLVQLMDGRIWAESELGRGSTFWFSARFRLPPEGWVRRMVRAEEIRGLRVLIADDNASAREILTSITQRFGMLPESVSDGATAIRRVLEAERAGQAFDLILMDWRMPAMDGIEAIEHICAEKAGATPAIVMVTAFGREDAMLAAQRHGVSMSNVVTKPVTPSALLEAIGRSLGQQYALAANGADAVRVDAVARERLKGARILLVEDNELNQELAIEILMQIGCEVIVAGNGAEALATLMRDADFDVVLMDCQMPVMDGYTAAMAIRSRPELAGLPIVALTANAMAGDREKVVAAGMNDHVSKPIDVDALIETLLKWVPVSSPRRGGDRATNAAGGWGVAAMPALSGVDVADGLARYLGNETLYRKALGKFRLAYLNFAAEFDVARQSEDVEAATRLAHTLASTAGNLGAVGLMSLARALESACQENLPIEVVTQHVERVQNELTQVLAGIAALAPAVRVDAAPVRQEAAMNRTEQLAKLRQLLVRSDSEAARVAQALLASVVDAAEHAMLTAVVATLTNYDFDAALEILDQRAG